MQFPFAKRVQLHIGYFSDASKPMYDYVVDVSQFVDLYSDSELCHHKGTHVYTLCSLLRDPPCPFCYESSTVSCRKVVEKSEWYLSAR